MAPYLGPPVLLVSVHLPELGYTGVWLGVAQDRRAPLSRPVLLLSGRRGHCQAPWWAETRVSTTSARFIPTLAHSLLPRSWQQLASHCSRRLHKHGRISHPENRSRATRDAFTLMARQGMSVR
jgi:hypothetical protein